MSAQEETNSGVTLSEAAARFAVSPQTLRRLCDTGQLSCFRDARGWRVHPREVENYLLARRPAGRQSIALWLQGPAPNPRLRDGVGWLIRAAGRGGAQIPIQIWFSNELVAILQSDNYDVRDVVVRAADRLVSDALLETDELSPGQEILYGSADRSFILRAAGVGDESYLPSEAPAEEGVSVLYELTPRDFAQDGWWPGDSIEVADTTYDDIVVDTRSDAAIRRVRTIRVPRDSVARTRVQAIENAVRAYERRCQGLGMSLGSWIIPIAARSNALTLAQQRVLELIAECWRKEGEWPLYTYVQSRIDHEYDLVLKDVLATFPPGLIYGLSSHQGVYQDRLVLTIAGLVHCENAAPDVQLFVAVLEYLVQKQREFVPSSSTQQENLAVISDEVRDNLPLASNAPQGAVERLYDFLTQDPYAFHGGGKFANGSWSVNVGPEIRRYRGVRTFQDYIARRQPNATTADHAQPLPSRHVGPISKLVQVTPDNGSDAGSVDVAPPEGAGYDADIFVLMPFAPDFDEVWTAVRESTVQFNVKCIRADSITLPGRITQQIIEAIRAASVIIADITGANPNVMFELGYADALGKPIVVLNQRLTDAPFDLKDWRQIQYKLTAMKDMKITLAKFLDQSLVKPRHQSRSTATVTGLVEEPVAGQQHNDTQRAGGRNGTPRTPEQGRLGVASQVLRSELLTVRNRLNMLHKSPFLVEPFELPSSEWMANRELIATDPMLYGLLQSAYSEVDRINYVWRWRKQQATGRIAANVVEDGLDAVDNAIGAALAALEILLGAIPVAQRLEAKPNPINRESWGYGRAIDGRLTAAFVSASVVVRELAKDEGLTELKCELYRPGEGSAPILSLPLRDPGWLVQAKGPRIERDVMFDLTLAKSDYARAPRATPGDELEPIVVARFGSDQNIESVVLPLIIVRDPYQAGG